MVIIVIINCSVFLNNEIQYLSTDSLLVHNHVSKLWLLYVSKLVFWMYKTYTITSVNFLTAMCRKKSFKKNRLHKYCAQLLLFVFICMFIIYPPATSCICSHGNDGNHHDHWNVFVKHVNMVKVTNKMQCQSEPLIPFWYTMYTITSVNSDCYKSGTSYLWL